MGPPHDEGSCTPWVAILRWNRSTAGTDAAAAGPICARDAAYRDGAPRSTRPRPNAAAHGREAGGGESRLAGGSGGEGSEEEEEAGGGGFIHGGRQVRRAGAGAVGGSEARMGGSESGERPLTCGVQRSGFGYPFRWLCSRVAWLGARTQRTTRTENKTSGGFAIPLRLHVG
jgi:hypothetical protein